MHHEPAERANSMKAAAIAGFSTIPYGLCLVKAMNPAYRSDRPTARHESIEQTRPAIRSWFSSHEYGSRRSG